MSRLFLFVLLISIVLTAESCVVQGKKEKPDIRVIELDDSSNESVHISIFPSSASSNMSRLFLFVLLISIVLTAESCIFQEKKEQPDIRVIELDDSSSESSEEEILALHLPDRQRREIDSRAKNGSCKTDEDCGPGKICLARLTCVKGKWRAIDSLETRAAN